MTKIITEGVATANPKLLAWVDEMVAAVQAGAPPLV